MKFYLIAAAVLMLFSSCLKQSITDAMLSKDKGSTATLSYQFNGNAVNITVDDADNQASYFGYTLACSKNPGYYTIEGLSNTGEITFTFYTDSLKAGIYRNAANYNDPFVTDYNGINAFVHAPSDSITVNITSCNNGHISGNFAGALSPLIVGSIPYDTYGAPGSILITNGTFKNVPVFY